MKVFIVYCHPSKDSFTNDVYKSFERGLRYIEIVLLMKHGQHEGDDLYADFVRTLVLLTCFFNGGNYADWSEETKERYEKYYNGTIFPALKMHNEKKCRIIRRKTICRRWLLLRV